MTDDEFNDRLVGFLMVGVVIWLIFVDPETSGAYLRWWIHKILTLR